MEFNNSIKESSDREHNAGLIYLIGLCLFESGNLEEATARISPLIYSHLSEEIRMKLRILLGRIYQSQGKHKKAVILFNTVPDRFAGRKPFYDLYYYRALAHSDLKKYGKARHDLDIFSSIATESSLYYDGLFFLGKIQLKLKNTTACIKLMDRVWKESKNSDLRYESTLVLANLLIESEPERVEFYLGEFQNLEDKGKKRKILLMLARAHVKSGKTEECKKILDFYLKNYPFDDKIDEIYFLKALMFIESKNFGKATFYFEKIKQEMPFSKFLNDSDYYLALLKYKQGKFNEAASLLRQYRRGKKIAFEVDSLSLLLEVYIKLKKWSQARKCALNLLKNFSKLKGVDKSLVNYAIAIYDYNRKWSKYLFKRILRDLPRTPSTVMIYLFLGNREFELNRYEKAVPLLEKYLNSDAGDDRGVAFFRLLKSCYNLKKYSRVIALIEKGKIPPLDELQWKEIPTLHARACYELGQYGRVYSIFRYKLNENPGDDNLLLLVKSLVKLGNLNRAMEISKSIKTLKLSMEALILFADYFSQRGDYLRAIDILSSEVEKYAGDDSPLYDRIRLKLAGLLLHEGKTEDVNKILNSIHGKVMFPQMISLRILYLFTIGDEKNASIQTRKNLKFVERGEIKEKIFEMNLEYSLKINNARDFAYYSRKLHSLKPDYVNFARGKFYLKNNKFRQSYSSFYKIASKKGKYFEETNYRLGMLSLLYYRKYKKALKFFSVLNFKNRNSYFSVLAGFESARILFEMKKYGQAREILVKMEKLKLSSKNREILNNLKAFYVK